MPTYGDHIQIYIEIQQGVTVVIIQTGEVGRGYTIALCIMLGSWLSLHHSLMYHARFMAFITL